MQKSMKFYFNPCFTRYSFEKQESRQELKRVKRMSKNDHNFNKSCEESSNSSASTSDETKINSLKMNHETYDMDDTYRPDDSLTLEYRGRITENLKRKQRKKLLIICGVGGVILLAIAGITAYIAVHFNRSSTPCESKTCQANAGKSIKDNKIDTDAISTVTTSIKYKEDTCATEQCKYIANNLKKSMNFTADPCDNFHEYACGNWGQSYPLPPSLPKLDTIGVLKQRKNLYLKNMIEKELLKKHSAGFKNKILKFYRSCQNVTAIEQEGKGPLLKFLSKFGDWSPIQTWTENGAGNPDITNLIVLSHQYFTPSVYNDKIKSPLFKTLVKVNDQNSEKHVLELNIPDLPISAPDTYLQKTNAAKHLMAKYWLLQSNYAALLGPSKRGEKNLRDVFDFEIKLANITFRSSMYAQHNPNQAYNLTTIEKMQKSVGSQIDWLKVVKGYFKTVKNVTITKDTEIAIRSIDFFQNLNKLIANTPEQVVKDYIIWVNVWKFGPYLSATFREADYNFQRAMFGIEERPERWKKCIADLEQTMEFGLASLYVEGALSARDKLLATDIIKSITNEFKRVLVNVEWMDMKTKASAFKKIESIIYNIGYPEYVKNETHLNLQYKRVRVHPRKYFENVLELYKDKRLSNLMLLNQPVDRHTYDLPPTLVEAYFDPNKNKMVFLAGILHVPIADSEGPMALNYGALGLVVGHEITHAFDNIGRMYDGNGERTNWWSESSAKAYDKRQTCMIDQYSNYTMYGMNVNGRLTLGENIADNGGIKVAYDAYKEWQRLHGKEKKLPGIELTMEQLLFVSHAQVWCGAYREEYMRQMLKVDYHSPAKYRIIGPLSNLKAFSKAYNCPLGSRMNPVKKCRVW